MFGSVNLADTELAAGMLIRGSELVIDWKNGLAIFAVWQVEKYQGRFAGHHNRIESRRSEIDNCWAYRCG